MNATELDLDTCNEAGCTREAQAMAAGVPMCWAHYRMWESLLQERRLAEHTEQQRQQREAKIAARRAILDASPIKIGDSVCRKSIRQPRPIDLGTVRQLFVDDAGRLKAKVHWHNGARWLGSREDGTASTIAVASLRAV